MARKESKKKFTVLLLIVLLLALAVGYAAFTDTLEISGTAKVNAGTFDVQFVSANCSATGVGCTAKVEVGNQESGSNVTNDKLTVTVSDLQYPGAGATITAQIKNVGTIPAKVTGATATPTGSISGNGNAIRIQGLDIFSSHATTLQPNGTCDFTFTVDWPNNINELNNALDGENGSSFSFDLEIQYEQDTANFAGNTSHTDTNP